MLVELAGHNTKTTMGQREDGVKTLVHSGRAKTEDFGEALDETFTNAYPNVKDAYKVIRDVVDSRSWRAAI